MDENKPEAEKAPTVRDEEAIKKTLAEQGIEFRPSGRFRGPPEPILDVDGILKFIVPDGKGKELLIKEMGGWKCVRCEHENIIPMNEEGKFPQPYQCESDTCGRKGPFKAVFPIELAKPIWKLPNRPIETNSRELYGEIFAFYRKHLVLKEHEYHILTAWTLASWLVDEFQFCPYLCLLAPKMSGKTQVFMALAELAYRAATVISVTPASLFRAIDLWRITLLVDEAERQITTKTETGQALYGCLNGGYKRGAYALRTEADGDRFIPAPYEVFGFKAFATTKLFDDTLESRSIIMNMVKALPKSILIDTKEGATLRSKLLFWRYEHLGRIKLVMPDTKSGRLIEMYTPLLTIAKIVEDDSPKEEQGKITEILKAEMNKAEHGLEREDRGTFEGEVVHAICEVRDREGLSEDGKQAVFIKDILQEMGFGDLEGKEKLSKTTRIGNALKILGITTDRFEHGKAIPLIKENLDKIGELERRYLAPQVAEPPRGSAGVQPGVQPCPAIENEPPESFLLYRDRNESVKDSESCLKDPPTLLCLEKGSGVHFQHAETMNPPPEPSCTPSGVQPGGNSPILGDSAGVQPAPAIGNEPLPRGSAGVQLGVQPETILPAHDASPVLPAHDRVQMKLLMIEVLTDVGNMALYNPEDKLITADLRKGDIASLPEVQARALIAKGAAKEIRPGGLQTPAQNQPQALPEKPRHRWDAQGIAKQLMNSTGDMQPSNANALKAVRTCLFSTGKALDPTYEDATMWKIVDGVLRDKGWM